MTMGKRRQRQESLFIMADGLPKSAGHPFYQKLNALLAEADFDRWIEKRCQRYYAQEEKRGQPSIPPGVYFRMLLVGYFEGIDSQRGIAWRCADSLSLRQFLGIPLDEATPDPTTLDQHPPPPAGRSVRRGVSVRALDRGRKEAALGQDGGRRQHALGSQRGHEEHRAARHGRGLEAVRHAADARGRRDRTGARADGRRGPPLRQAAKEQEGLERRVGFAHRSREPHHADERRPHAPGLQGRARGGSEERPDPGGRDLSGRPRRHADAGR